MNSEIQLPYQICLSADPFDNVIEIEMKITGTHDTMGMKLEEKTEFGNRVQLQDCICSTPALKLPKWRL